MDTPKHPPCYKTSTVVVTQTNVRAGPAENQNPMLAKDSTSPESHSTRNLNAALVGAKESKVLMGHDPTKFYPLPIPVRSFMAPRLARGHFIEYRASKNRLSAKRSAPHCERRQNRFTPRSNRTHITAKGRYGVSNRRRTRSGLDSNITSYERKVNWKNATC